MGGMQEILGAIQRKRYKEVALKDVQKWKLGGSCLGVRWHIRDLVGRGSVVETHTPSGPFLRLVKPG